jgi:hypothetical protein
MLLHLMLMDSGGGGGPNNGVASKCCVEIKVVFLKHDYHFCSSGTPML